MIKKCLKTEYLITAEVIKNCEVMYKNKEYAKVLTLLERSLHDLEISCDKVLSTMFDFIASALWKLSNYDDALELWKRALKHDENNRHAKMCVTYFEDTLRKDYYLELFLKIKLNEYYSINFDSDEAFLTSEKAIIDLTKYWFKHLERNNFSSLSEHELIEHFTNIDLVENLKTI